MNIILDGWDITYIVLLFCSVVFTSMNHGYRQEGPPIVLSLPVMMLQVLLFTQMGMFEQLTAGTIAFMSFWAWKCGMMCATGFDDRMIESNGWSNSLFAAISLVLLYFSGAIT